MVPALPSDCAEIGLGKQKGSIVNALLATRKTIL
jgi:hypothetical protein